MAISLRGWHLGGVGPADVCRKTRLGLRFVSFKSRGWLILGQFSPRNKIGQKNPPKIWTPKEEEIFCSFEKHAFQVPCLVLRMEKIGKMIYCTSRDFSRCT